MCSEGSPMVWLHPLALFLEVGDVYLCGVCFPTRAYIVVHTCSNHNYINTYSETAIGTDIYMYKHLTGNTSAY